MIDSIRAANAKLEPILPSLPPAKSNGHRSVTLKPAHHLIFKMPYSYRSNRPYDRAPRRTYKRKTYASRSRTPSFLTKKYSAIDLAVKAVKGVAYLKTLVNSEMLELTTAVVTNASTTPVWLHFTAVAQGDDESARTGNSILTRRLQMSFLLGNNASATATQVRVIVIKTNQQAPDTAPTTTDLFGTATPGVNDLYSNDRKNFVTVLYDKVFLLNNFDAINAVVNFDKSVQFHTLYNGTSGTDIQKNGVYVVYFSNQATNTATATGSIRVGYHDN